MTVFLLEDIKVGDKVRFKYHNTKVVKEIKHYRTLYLYFTDGTMERYFLDGRCDCLFNITKRKNIIEVIKGAGK